MSNFPFAFRSALPEGGLLFGEMTCTQAVSSLDKIELNLLSPRDDIALEQAHGLAAHEQFDFDGSYTQLDDGRRWASDLIEELQSRHERLAGTTNEPITAAQAITLPVFAMSMHITGLCVATPTPLISYDYDYGPDHLLKPATLANPEVKVNVLTYQQAHTECLHCQPRPLQASPPTIPQPRCPACCANTRSKPSTCGCKEACSSARRMSPWACWAVTTSASPRTWTAWPLRAGPAWLHGMNRPRPTVQTTSVPFSPRRRWRCCATNI